MTEYFSQTSNDKVKKRHLIIMDEVDGMSGGDRGGTQQLIAMIKKTKIPIICICNDRQSPKVRSLVNHCIDIRFRKFFMFIKDRPTNKLKIVLKLLHKSDFLFNLKRGVGIKNKCCS